MLRTALIEVSSSGFPAARCPSTGSSRLLLTLASLLPAMTNSATTKIVSSVILGVVSLGGSILSKYTASLPTKLMRVCNAGAGGVLLAVVLVPRLSIYRSVSSAFSFLLFFHVSVYTNTSACV